MKSWRSVYRSDDNVIYLNPSQRGATQTKKRVYYLHHAQNYWNDLNQITHFDLYDISCRDKLYVFGEMVQPDLVLFDKEVDWIDPIEAIDWVSHQFGVPVILLASKKIKKLSPQFIRQAYSAGIYDILYYPAAMEEVMESLEILLKFPKVAR